MDDRDAVGGESPAEGEGHRERQDPGRAGRIALGAGIGIVFGSAFGTPGRGMVIGAAIGLAGGFAAR